jgi:hypothetical protein
VLGRDDGGEEDQRLAAFGTEKELTRCHADGGDWASQTPDGIYRDRAGLYWRELRLGA